MSLSYFVKKVIKDVETPQKICFTKLKLSIKFKKKKKKLKKTLEITKYIFLKLLT